MTARPEPGDDTRVRALLAAAPVPAPPPERVRRWKATLAELPAPTATRDPPGRRRAAGPRAAGIAALAAAVIAVALLGPAASGPLGSPGPDPDAPLTLSRDQLSLRSVVDTLTGHDLGPLADPATRAACLAAAGVAAEPLGGRRVLLDGRPGVLLALPTDRVGRVRLLVVAPDCGPGGARVLADRTVGR